MPSYQRERALALQGCKASELVLANTVLLACCENGDTLLAARVLSRGADPDALVMNEHRNVCALALAAKNGHADMVELLLNAGADLNSALGKNALFSACAHNQHRVIALLVGAGSDPNGLDPSLNDAYHCHTPLARAARCLALESVEALLALGARPEAHAGQSSSPLVCALDSYGGDKELRERVLLRLLRAGADPNPLTPESAPFNAPLMTALLHGHARCLELLLGWGADPNVYNAKGHSVVHMACERRLSSELRVLLVSGASPDLPTRAGKLPREIAQGDPETLAVLDACLLSKHESGLIAQQGELYPTPRKLNLARL